MARSSMNMNPHRRRVLIGSLAALAGVPLFDLVAPRRLTAGELPHLSEDDPAAKALKYHSDATRADRADKAGTSAKDQFCHNCRFVQADSGQWRPCQLFPGKAVNADGWCSSWTPREG